MKAVELDGFGGPEVMRVVERPEPVPGPGQILVRVAASSVNRPDIIQREGRYPPPPGESEIPGLEIAGTVEASAPDVTEYEAGDRVFALVGGGGYAELATAYAGHALPIPEGVSFSAAACIAETYITAYQNLFLNAGLRDGESVLLHGGGGGVNTAAIQIVRFLTPSNRIAVTASPGKLDRVRAVGADLVIDYRNEDFADRILEEFDDGVDVILDHIGASYLAQNLRCLAVNGRLAIIAVVGGAKAEINLARLMVRRQTIIGSVLRPRPLEEKAAIVRRFGDALLPAFASGAIAPIIDSEFPLADVVEAHRRMETRAHFGKIVLKMA